MTLYELYLNLSVGVGVVVASLVLLIHRRWRVTRVSAFFVVWAFVSLFEYYFLGENSYIPMDEEGAHFLPFYLYLLNGHLGGQFGHAISGGADIYTAISPSIQLVTPELVWLSLFPIWIAVLIHKFIVIAVGFFGSYYLCRATTQANVFICCAVAALFTVSTHNLTIVTYSVGAGLSFLPLLMYVVVVRSDCEKYWRATLPTIIIAAFYIDPTHNAEPVFLGLALSALLFDRINARVIISTMLAVIFFLINWGEPLFAMMQMSPYTIRGGNYSTELDIIAQLLLALQSTWGYLLHNKIIIVLPVVLGILFWKNDSSKYRTLIVFTLGILSLPILSLFPFSKIGLGAVTNLSHHYVLLALTGLMLSPLAKAAMVIDAAAQDWRYSLKNAQWGGVAVLAVTVGCLGYFKAYNLGSMLYHGGQSQYHSVDTVMSEDWRPKTPFRVMTLRVRDIGSEPGLAHGIFGLEPFDAFQMLPTKKRSLFIAKGIRKNVDGVTNYDPRIFVDWARWQNGAYHGISEQLSLDLLRLSNVAYILSPIPFDSDSGVTLVAGPVNPPMVRMDASENVSEYIKERLRRLVDFTDLYIYELPKPYPQVFAPKYISVISNEMDDESIISAVKRSAQRPAPAIVVSESDSNVLGKIAETFNIRSFERIPDGYVIKVKAPNGGIVVLNSTKLPFWKAYTDGVEAEIVSANFSQMAIRVPPETKHVLFNYDRPMLRDLLQGSLTN